MGDAVRRSVQPGGQRVAVSNPGGVFGEDQKRRLERILRGVGIAQGMKRDRHHQAAVTGDDLGKGRLFPRSQKPGNQVPIAGPPGRRLTRATFSRRLHSAMLVPGGA